MVRELIDAQVLRDYRQFHVDYAHWNSSNLNDLVNAISSGDVVEIAINGTFIQHIRSVCETGYRAYIQPVMAQIPALKAKYVRAEVTREELDEITKPVISLGRIAELIVAELDTTIQAFTGMQSNSQRVIDYRDEHVTMLKEFRDQWDKVSQEFLSFESN